MIHRVTTVTMRDIIGGINQSSIEGMNKITYTKHCEFCGTELCCFKKCVRAEIKRRSTDFFRFVNEKQQIQKNRRLMDFTKEQLSEVLCKHAEGENGLQDLMEIMIERLRV